MGGINLLIQPYEMSQAMCTSDATSLFSKKKKKGDYFPCDHQDPPDVNVIYDKMIHDAPPLISQRAV